MPGTRYPFSRRQTPNSRLASRPDVKPLRGLRKLDESILDPATGRIDQRRLPLVARRRVPRSWYCQVDPAKLCSARRRRLLGHLGIGIDALPPAIRQSSILTGSRPRPGRPAIVHVLPTVDPAVAGAATSEARIFQYFAGQSRAEMEVNFTPTPDSCSTRKGPASLASPAGTQLVFKKLCRFFFSNLRL